MNGREPNAEWLPLSSNATAPERPKGTRLEPAQPPGRNTRKALTYSVEMRRLYAMGYTLEAIREALLAVGVSVSRSTVYREVRRNGGAAPNHLAAQHATAGVESVQPTPQPGLPQATGVRDPPRSQAPHKLLGKQDVEAFFAAHDSNPLSSTKEAP